MKKISLIVLISALMTIALMARITQVTIAGSTTVLPVAQAAAEAFMDKFPAVNISVRGGGSGVGIAALQNGTVDIVMSSRRMKSQEISVSKSRGINPTAYAVAKDGIAIIVHETNKINNITLAQIRDIYTGKVTNWNQLGGANLPIVSISRDVASGTFEVFNAKVLKDAKVSGSAQMMASNNAILRTVTITPGAIGYVGLGYVTDAVNVVPVNNVVPSEATIRNGSYPVSRNLYMYTNGKARGDAARYLGFLQGPEGQEIVKQQGFITLN